MLLLNASNFPLRDPSPGRASSVRDPEPHGDNRPGGERRIDDTRLLLASGSRAWWKHW